jgi:hypothetical protein
MELSEIANTLVFTLIPGLIILATMALGIVHQSKTVPTPDLESNDSKHYPLDPMVMCLADVSVSLSKQDQKI